MKTTHLALALVGGAAAVFVASRISQRGIAGAASDLGVALGQGAAGLFNGAVLGIGDAVGLPRTDLSAGQQAWQKGNYLEASKLMPAGDFLGAVWDSLTSSSPGAPAIDPARAEAERNSALYGGTVENWLGYSYIDNDPLQLRGTGAPVASKWGTSTSAGWPWEHSY